MRIAFLSPLGELGGAERCLVDLAVSLRQADPLIEMLVLAATEGPLLARLASAGVPAAVVPMSRALLQAGDTALRSGGPLHRAATMGRVAMAGAAALAHTMALSRAIRRFRPDVIHSNGMKHHILGMLAAPRGPRIVWHMRDLVGERALMARALSLIGGRVAGAVAVSRLVSDDLARAVPRVRTEVVPDAIDVDEFAPGPGDPARLDAIAGLPPGAASLRVGLVATYSRWKGQDLFLETAARLAATVPGSRFYIIGGPIYATRGSQFTEAELRAIADQLRIADRVGFVPFQPDPAWLFRTLDIVVHASTRPEPFGRTIAEAAASGRPVVATRTSGAAEALEHGREALLVPPRNPEALASALEELAANPARRAALGQAAHRAARERFSRERLGPQLLAAYSRLGVLGAG